MLNYSWLFDFKTMLKRAFDITISVAILIVLSPVLVMVSIAVAFSSPGPIFYRAIRVGYAGREFKLYKFRSMVANADQYGPGITRAGDSRITTVGRILRRTKLDEIPQLFNVLRGDMSLVGPRPEDPRYVVLYTPEQRQVLTVRPGITSLASVQYRNEEAILAGADWEAQYIHHIMPTKLSLDLQYIHEANLWHDIGILVRTFRALWR